jgi:hypothetical protein
MWELILRELQAGNGTSQREFKELGRWIGVLKDLRIGPCNQPVRGYETHLPKCECNADW